MPEGPIAERGVLTATDAAWDAAVRAAEVIGPLAGHGTVGLAAAQDAAARLGVSRRQMSPQRARARSRSEFRNRRRWERAALLARNAPTTHVARFWPHVSLTKYTYYT